MIWEDLAKITKVVSFAVDFWGFSKSIENEENSIEPFKNLQRSFKSLKFPQLFQLLLYSIVI